MTETDIVELANDTQRRMVAQWDAAARKTPAEPPIPAAIWIATAIRQALGRDHAELDQANPPPSPMP
jgi:hypothetical protein